jgi:hypothetical protein
MDLEADSDVPLLLVEHVLDRDPAEDGTGKAVRSASSEP